MNDVATSANREGATSFGRALAAFHRRSTVLAWILSALLIVMLAVHAFLAETFTVPSASMNPTLAVGDRILVKKVGDIRRGDVVVFSGDGSLYQSEPTSVLRQRIDGAFEALGFRIGEIDYVKRVIGVGGDRVEVTHAGQLLVNGQHVREPYLPTGQRKASAQPFKVTVPAGHFFVMGDNRNYSDDSRNHLGDPGGGFVPRDKVVGTLWQVYWSAS